jgi:hypothetical protein
VPKSSINVLHLSWICLKKSPMQISKLSVAICATFVGVLPLVVHAADSEAQAKAREALEKAMSQPAPQTAPTPSAPAKPQKPTPAPAPAAAQPAAQPVSAAPAATTTSTPSVTMAHAPAGMSSEDTDRVRAALRQKMAEQPVPPPVVVKPVSPTTPPPVAVKPVSPTTPPPGHKMTPPPGPPPVAHTAIQAPALPISATKEAQLQELLVRYKADQISPEDYHKERAKILAGP